MKEPIVLLINDIHVSKDNIPEFEKNWDEMLEICKKQGIYDVVIGGDLWDSRSGQTLNILLAVQHAIQKATGEYELDLTIAEGNHCKVDQEQLEGYSHLFEPYPHVKTVNVFDIMSWDGCDYFLVPMSYFPEDGSFVKHLEELKDELDKRHILLSCVILYIHEGIAGGIGGGFVAPTDLDPKIFEGFHSVLVGHYHNRIKIPNTNIEYIGSSRQHSFGEDEAKGYTILYDDGSTKFIQNQVNTRYLNVERDYDEIDQLPVFDDPRYKVKLKLNCTETEAKILDREALTGKGINRIEIITKKTKENINQSDIDEKYDGEGIRKEYIEFSNKNDIDPTLGVEYLNKIK